MKVVPKDSEDKELLSTEKEPYGSVMLSELDLSVIEEMAASNYAPSDIALYLSINKTAFLTEYRDIESVVRHHYDRGRLIADFEINQKLLQNAKSGNITAAQVYEKNRDRITVENLKQQIYFGGA